MIESSRKRIRARAAAFLAATALALAACSDSTEPDPTGLTGQWDYVISGAETDPEQAGATVSCDVDRITLSFLRDNGSLSGTVAAQGPDNLQCVVDGEERLTTLSGNTFLSDLREEGGVVEFTIDAVAGPWVSTGTIQNGVMGGTVSIHVTFDLSTFQLTGEWTATRR